MTKPKNELPPLFKAATGGRILKWRIWVEPASDGADIVVQYGFSDGKQQEQRDRVTQGKNIGHANATTPLAQAYAEARSRWTKQLERKGYGLDVEASASVRSLSPMLAQVYSDHAKKIEWGSAFVQNKLDGFRCIALMKDGKILLKSRENKPIITMPHIVEALQPLFVPNPSLILDGELYTHEHADDFNKISSLIRRQQEGSVKIQYHVYDLLSPSPFKHRYEELRSAVAIVDTTRVKLVNTVMVDGEEELFRVWQNSVEEGYEGCMLRYGTQGYEAGKRSSRLLKCKNALDEDFEIVEVSEGRGTHRGMAIFTCVTKAGHDFDVLAPGTHAEKAAYWANWQEQIGKMVTVEFQNYSKTSEPCPRFPRALRVL